MKKKVSEEELAQMVIDHYENLGYVTYKEVTAKGSKGGGTHRADIIAVKGDEYITIETKVGFGLKVIEQAFAWKSKSNKSYIAVPKTKRTNTKKFGYEICRDLGVGVIEIDTQKRTLFTYCESTININPDLPKLYEEQKDEIAGVSGGYITPFKITKDKILEYVKQKEECSLSELVENIDHHYRSNNSAKQSISKLIRIGVIELTLFKVKGKIFIKL